MFAARGRIVIRAGRPVCRPVPLKLMSVLIVACICSLTVPSPRAASRVARRQTEPGPDLPIARLRSFEVGAASGRHARQPFHHSAIKGLQRCGESNNSTFMTGCNIAGISRQEAAYCPARGHQVTDLKRKRAANSAALLSGIVSAFWWINSPDDAGTRGSRYAPYPDRRPRPPSPAAAGPNGSRADGPRTAACGAPRANWRHRHAPSCD